MAITKKTRFEVFKRDSFTCQYCGKSAPDVILHVDHIHPKSKGGDDDLLNLLTSCVDCNQGKKAVPLSDGAALAKRKKQLDKLQQRREQLEMLLDWHKSLLTLDDDALNGVAEVWDGYTPGWTINDHGLQELRKWLKRYGVNEILAAMDAAATQYLEEEQLEDGRTRVTLKSWQTAFGFIPRICSCNRRCKEKPYLKELYYARGILRKRVSYCNDWEALQLMEDAVLAGAPPASIVDITRRVRNWTDFRTAMRDAKEQANDITAYDHK